MIEPILVSLMNLKEDKEMVSLLPFLPTSLLPSISPLFLLPSPPPLPLLPPNCFICRPKITKFGAP